MADFAGTYFWQKALLWHSRLPQDVRHDWYKLGTVLLDRWPPPEEDDEPQIKPTPAAAPSLGLNDQSNRPMQGIMKVIIDQSKSVYYVTFTDCGVACETTTDMGQAICVRSNPAFGTTLLERT
ncbi:hypothetical protein FRC01_014336, partial [Tulasnella sp. 417]